MNIRPLSLMWEIRRPPDESQRDPDWLVQVTEMRGRVLYAGGRRPRFRQADGSCVDRDWFDHDAYHVLLRDSDMLIGCIRVVPLRNVRRCLTESLLQDRPFEQLLTWLGNGRDRVGEVGRWVVAPEYAPFRMGLRLAVAAGVLAKQLGLETIIAMVGTRDGQARTLMRAGGQRVPGLAPVRSQTYDDDLVVLTFDLSRPANVITLLAAEMTTRLSMERGDKAWDHVLPREGLINSKFQTTMS